MKVQQCRSCKAPIIWAVNDRTRKRAPIDAAPAAGGTVIFTHEPGHGGDPEYHVMTLTERELADTAGANFGIPRHKNHWQTCPTKEQHKKGGR